LRSGNRVRNFADVSGQVTRHGQWAGFLAPRASQNDAHRVTAGVSCGKI
jgi:hypothetical protein